MIGVVKSPFYPDKTEKGLGIQQFLANGEEIVRTFKSVDMNVFFTNKRIILAYIEKSLGEVKIEFVSYRSIERFTYLSSENLNTYNVEVFFPNCIVLQFTFSSQSEAFNFIKLLDGHI